MLLNLALLLLKQPAMPLVEVWVSYELITGSALINLIAATSRREAVPVVFKVSHAAPRCLSVTGFETSFIVSYLL